MPGGARSARRALGRRRVDRQALARLAAANPYLSIRAIVNAGTVMDRTAGRYLDALTRLGLGRNVRWGRLRLLRLSALADAIEPIAWETAALQEGGRDAYEDGMLSRR